MNQKDHIPDILLERFALGELPDDKRREIEEAMTRNSRIAERLAEIEVSNRKILSEYPAEEMSLRITDRMEEISQSEKETSYSLPFPVTRLAIPVAAAAVLAFAFGILPNISREEAIFTPEVSMERVKGMEPDLTIYREDNNEAEPMSSGMKAKENDRLQIEYNAAGKKYGVIFSIDGRGAISLHFPDYTGAPNLLDVKGDVALPFSYQLDDAPDFERFFFISSDESFAVSDIMDQARRLAENSAKRKTGDLPLSEKYKQVTVLIKKERSK